VRQIVDKGHLGRLVQMPDIAVILHYNDDTKTLSVEDPHLMYFLSNIDWAGFVQEVGFTNVAPQFP